MNATRLLALSCIALLGACTSDASGEDTDGGTDTDVAETGENTASSDTAETSETNASSDPETGGSTSGDDSTSGDPTDTDDPTETGSNPGDPQIPELQGECPEFVAGTVDNPAMLEFPVGAGSRQALVYFDPAQGGGGPLVFFFHGGGGEAEQAESTVTGEAIADILANGGMVIAPIADPAANLSWFLASGSAQNDIVMQDSMVACADAGPGIDRHRIHAIGFSAGGIHVAMASILRASYMASTVTYSGGTYNGVTPDTEEATASALVFHGGPSDNVGGLNFMGASDFYAGQLRDRGGYAIVCNHGTGHGYPDNEAGVWRRADAYNFLREHPYGVSPFPYAGNFPDWVPPYCEED